MQRFWTIAPVESKDAELFDRVWGFCLKTGFVSIGWNELGDCSRMTREEILAQVQKTYHKKPPQTQSLFANMIWTFFNEIREGDIVIARRGRKLIEAVGTVTRLATFGDPQFVATKPKELNHQNSLGVNWNASPRDLKFPTIVFSMHTLSELKKDVYDDLIAGKITPLPDIPDDGSLENPAEFVLEKYLEDFIVTNFSTVFKNTLQIYVDANGIDGQQYETDVGNIDILAFDKKTNEFVVIELKKGLTSDKVVGQTLRYMGWVKMNLCTNGEGVRGMIVCGKPDKKLTCALTMVPNIAVRYYTVDFKLSESP